jgi:3-dehydroquinate synthase
MGTKVDLADIDGDLPDADTLLALMAQDKKVQNGKLAFIMARSIGDSFVTRDVDLAVVKSVLEDALSAR